MNPDAILHAMTAQPLVAMTLDEWAALEEDTEGEIVDGILVEEEVPSYLHEVVVTWLVHVLLSWVGDDGWVGGSDAKFAVRARRGRKPDVSVFLAGRRPPARGVIRLPPDIVIEVVSPDPRDERRDRVEKYDDYAAFGVRWYWLLDPALRILEIYELGGDARYTRACAGTDARVDSVPGCPGLALDLPALWARIDRLEEDGNA
jgi:Uma2 family endonuclease